MIPGFEISARGTSATEVGGDYYDFFPVDENRLGIVVADVSGKGVHAALVAAMIRSAFRTQARGNPDVRDVLSRINEFISHDLRRDMFITCVYGILEIPTRRFSWARAGHEPLIVAHNSHEVDVLTPSGFALGVIESPEFGEMLEVQTIEMHSGDRILMYTDGLTEAMNPSGEEFGMQRILHVMSHLNGHGSTADGADGDSQIAEPVAQVPAAASAATGLDGNRSDTAGQALQGGVAARPDRLAAASGSAAAPGSAAAATPQWSCTPETAPPDSEDLLSMERAVQEHVAGAEPSDDLTIVYLAAN